MWNIPTNLTPQYPNYFEVDVIPQPPPKILSIKEQVEAKFGKDSVMSKIASCESGYRQFASNGEVLRGVVNSADVGIFQINEMYHLAAAEKLGIDIYTVEGNLAFAEHLFKTQGTRPWNWSVACWGK